MITYLNGLIVEPRVRKARLPQIDAEFETTNGDKVHAVLFIGPTCVEKISHRTGKTLQEFREGLTNKKIEIIIE